MQSSNSFVSAQQQYSDYNFNVTAGEIKSFDGYLPEYGMIDLRYLTFSSHQDSPTGNETTFEVAAFRLDCSDDDDGGCGDDTTDWTLSGVGAKMADGSTMYCCTQEAIDENLCSNAGHLIVDPLLFNYDNYGDTPVPGLGAWVHHVDQYYGGFEEYEAGKYVTLFANCDEDDGRLITVSGKADFGSKTKPFDVLTEIRQCGVPVSQYMFDEEETTFEFLDFMLDPVADKCDAVEEQHFRRALSDFEKCSSLDWSTFIESFPSAIVGNVIHCGRWMKEISKWAANQYNEHYEENVDDYTFHDVYTPDWHEIYDLPGRAECQNALEGHNVYGDTLHKLVFEPESFCECASQSLDKDDLPQCTIDTWPIPLVGDWISIASCLIQSGCRQLDTLCEAEMEVLHEQLPIDINNGDEAIDCNSVDLSAASIMLNLPQQYTGAPLPDTCVRIAQSETYADKAIVERYEAYRAQCTEQWDGWASSSYVAGGTSGGENDGAVIAIVFISLGTVALLLFAFLVLRRRGTNTREHPSTTGVGVRSVEMLAQNNSVDLT